MGDIHTQRNIMFGRCIVLKRHDGFCSSKFAANTPKSLMVLHACYTMQAISNHGDVCNRCYNVNGDIFVGTAALKRCCANLAMESIILNIYHIKVWETWSILTVWDKQYLNDNRGIRALFLLFYVRHGQQLISWTTHKEGHFRITASLSEEIHSTASWKSS